MSVKNKLVEVRVEEKITIENVCNYILYNYHLSAANNIEMDLIAGADMTADKHYNRDLMEKHKSQVKKYKLPEEGYEKLRPFFYSPKRLSYPASTTKPKKIPLGPPHFANYVPRHFIFC